MNRLGTWDGRQILTLGDEKDFNKHRCRFWNVPLQTMPTVITPVAAYWPCPCGEAVWRSEQRVDKPQEAAG